MKALVLKTERGSFIVGLVAADRRIDLKRVAKVVGAKKLRLASAEEVLKLTGCEVGSVHPFGNLFGLPTYMDRSVLENDMRARLRNQENQKIALNPCFSHISYDFF